MHKQEAEQKTESKNKERKKDLENICRLCTGMYQLQGKERLKETEAEAGV